MPRDSSRRQARLAKRLAASFEQIADAPARIRRQRARDFVFHMRDWESDLFALAKLFRAPERYSAEQFRRVLAGFLIHVPAHLVQAARLAEQFNDTFKERPLIGATGRRQAAWSPAPRRPRR